VSPTLPPIERVTGAYSLEVKWSGREANYSFPLVPRLRMRGAISALTNTYSWRDA